jgi:hypothetical protein
MREKFVKGYVVASIVEGVRDALGRGRIGQDQVEIALGSHAAVLDQKIDPFRWYPVELLEGLNRLLAEASGGDRRAAMLALGAEQFELFTSMGVHQQLSSSNRKASESSPKEIASWGRLVSTMMRSVCSFSRATFEADPAAQGRYVLDWRGIEGLGDIVLESTLGFMTALAERSAGPEVRVTLERPAPNHARYVFEGAR